MPHVLFVCTGNLCRSPMAAALFAAELARAGLTGWTVSSAGTWAVAGHPATREAVAALAARGLDLGAHRSRQLTAEQLEQADLILVATRAHAEAIRAEFAPLRAPIWLFSELVGERYDVPDPYGLSQADYEATAAELARLIAAGLPRARALLEGRSSG
jgi:protein-tyrosine phosphatase